MAESDYARFRIEKAELASRRSWNSSTRSQVEALKNTFAAVSRDRKASTKPQGGRCVRSVCAHWRCSTCRKPGLPPLTPCCALPIRSAAAKLENAITSQNESYLNNQTDQQALLLRHGRARYVALSRARVTVRTRAGGKTRTWMT